MCHEKLENPQEFTKYSLPSLFLMVNHCKQFDVNSFRPLLWTHQHICLFLFFVSNDNKKMIPNFIRVVLFLTYHQDPSLVHTNILHPY